MTQLLQLASKAWPVVQGSWEQVLPPPVLELVAVVVATVELVAVEVATLVLVAVEVATLVLVAVELGSPPLPPVVSPEPTEASGPVVAVDTPLATETVGLACVWSPPAPPP